MTNWPGLARNLTLTDFDLRLARAGRCDFAGLLKFRITGPFFVALWPAGRLDGPVRAWKSKFPGLYRAINTGRPAGQLVVSN